MTEQQAPAAAPAPAPAKAPAKKHKKRKVRNIIIAVIVVAALAVGGFLLWKFLNKSDEEKGEILTDTATRSSIQSKVEGSGMTKAKDSATITLGASGTVAEIFVSEGEMVTQGQPLYRITSPTAEDEVVTARTNLMNRQKELDDLYKELSQLTVKASFDGQLLDVASFTVGDDVSKGTTVATLVDNTKLKLSVYFSYAYEKDIYVGQKAEVSVPAVMSSFTGTVEEVNMVRRVSPEGSVLFEAVIVLDNPGTLTADMTASAVLTDSTGTSIYPYSSVKLAYYRTITITTKAAGPVEQVSLLNYAGVKSGDVLLVMGDLDTAASIREKQKEVDTATENLKSAEEALSDFNAVAPISGTVISCSLTPGLEVKSGDTAITISDTSVMTVEISIDERNVSYVKPGMSVDLDQWGTVYTGVVESVGQQGTGQSGISTFPAVVKVENSSGQLMSGMYVTYSFVASQSDDCLVIPIQCVRYVNDENGEPATVVFLQRDSAPENAVTLDSSVEIPDGFYAVPVKTGLSDTYNVEITEGLTDGDVVFTNYNKDQADSMGMG
ncbi:hypothetical protein SDC9_49543 [bioreactor metagenome]|uniref:CzcB-like barrel-sandwich hybrid domain-containing protein n=1 Tax=bioreactor metagenome TaxID=1076179 RepID=A0A644WIF4_9ZZZZ